MGRWLVVWLWAALAHGQTVLVIGDSLTEGYGLDAEDAFPAVLEGLLRPKHKAIKVINGGVSGSTTASAVQRVKWFARAKPHVVVLALGANDGLRGLDVQESRKHLEAAVTTARGMGMKVLLAGMQMPTNYGRPYRAAFEKMYADLARDLKLPLLPFLLEGVGGVPAMNLADGIHPNKAGHARVAQNLARSLEGHL